MITVAHADIRKVLDAEILRLLPFMGLTQKDIAWPNAKFSPKVKQSYLRVFILPGQSVQSSLGPDCLVKLVGVYQVSIFEPKNTGIAEAEKKAGIILNEFPLGRILSCCEQWITITQAYSGVAVEDEDRLHLPISIAYNCHAPQFQNRADIPAM